MARSSAVRFLVAGAAAAALAACGVVPSKGVAFRTPAPGDARRVVSAGQLARELAAAAAESGTVHIKGQVAGRDDGTGPVTVTGVVRMFPPAASYRYEAAEGPSRLVVVDGVGYVRGMPTRVRGKPWLKLDAATLEWLGASRAVLDLDTGDVTGLTTFGADRSFTDSGSTSVPGTRLYTAHLTTEEWVTATHAEPYREEAREWAADQRVTGATVLLFVAENGLPVKQIFTLLPNSVQVTTQIEFSRWGEPVSITAPPRRSVVRCADTPVCQALRTA
jgi:hypothetical protein